MELKQMSITVPKNLLKESQEYSAQYGYRNVQELILELLRQKVVLEKVEIYKEIEAKMKAGVGVKKFDKKSALKYLKEL